MGRDLGIDRAGDQPLALECAADVLIETPQTTASGNDMLSQLIWTTVEDVGMATTEERNMKLMQTLDDAWNGQDVDVFRARHKPDVVVRWSGQAEPTRGIEDHITESEWFWTAFPDQHLDNRPYRIFFASGNHACSVARFTGSMTGALKNWAGDEMQPTGQSFEVDFYTVAQWDDGQIVDENLMYDLVRFMQQLGLSG